MPDAATILKDRFDPVSIRGAVLSVGAQTAEISDRLGSLKVGARVEIETDAGALPAEIIALSPGSATALPFGSLEGIALGAAAQFVLRAPGIAPCDGWLGRIVNGLGEPIDDKGPLPRGTTQRPVRARPPRAPQRARLGGPIDFGVRALSCFTPARVGQRFGVFSAAGVGKSALMAMIARNTECDIAVIGLIGERGREVREFIEDSLGPEGLARSVVVVATADEPALMRREAAYLSLAIAEHFRDAGAHVLCLMDSLTRIAHAQREIGLATGEPPTTKGFTPSVFSLLPAIIERAGPGQDGAAPGYISAIFSVLVEGDDHDEPIADAARACLDGHIVLARAIAERGRLPAIDILRSVSRTMPGALSGDRAGLVREAKALASAYDDMRDLIRFGAYKAGSDPVVDRAIAIRNELEDFLSQDIAERAEADVAFARLSDILRGRV
ncbi:MAG: FliI/YscN family ATPase [Pseudomonadota bacterium]